MHTRTRTFFLLVEFNTTWNDLGLNLDLYSDRLVTKHTNHGLECKVGLCMYNFHTYHTEIYAYSELHI